MFIQTDATPDPATIHFLPGQEVLPSQAVEFDDEAAAARSPLARRLFQIDAVWRVGLGHDFVSVTKDGETEWQHLKPQVLGAMVEHFMSGEPVLADPADAPSTAMTGEIDLDGDDPSEMAAQVRELIDTRIRPVAEQSGGEVLFRGLKDGIAYLEMSGGATTLLTGIRNMVRHYVPDILDVRDYRDAIPKPGLDTAEGKAIQSLLNDQINPSVASHGGHIALVDVREDTVYIRLEGGCQGCGMADVTLKQGIEVEIKRAVPAILAVLDVTDHAGGTNPYYQPGK
jgi:Fe-S cluster biogenesis protein NfuA